MAEGVFVVCEAEGNGGVCLVGLVCLVFLVDLVSLVLLVQ